MTIQNGQGVQPIRGDETAVRTGGDWRDTREERSGRRSGAGVRFSFGR